MATPLEQAIAARRGGTGTLTTTTTTGSGGSGGTLYVVNVDGGGPASNYGGLETIDAGGI